MNHMSRERITFDERVRLIRENYGVVSLEGGYITACSYTWMLTVRVSTVLQGMGLNDFKKMLRVVKHQLDSDYYWMYLGYWRDEISRFRNEPTPAIADMTKIAKFESRFIKMLTYIQKEEDKLPAYVFENE